MHFCRRQIVAKTDQWTNVLTTRTTTRRFHKSKVNKYLKLTNGQSSKQQEQQQQEGFTPSHDHAASRLVKISVSEKYLVGQLPDGHETEVERFNAWRISSVP